MSTLKERLSSEIKTAMKSGQKDTLTFARNLHAAIRKKEIDERIDLDDAGLIKIASSLVKQRQDSIEQFRQGGREDLATKEEAEMKFLQSYLPQQMSESELRSLIDAAIAESGAASPKEMGAVMKLLMPKTAGKVDGKLMSQIVTEKLKAKAGS